MLNELSKEIHKNAVNKGFWESENIAEKMMLVVTEIAEAVEAHRSNNFCSLNEEEFIKMLVSNKDYFNIMFEKNIKDTMFDEIADTIIRLLDICGFMNINIEKHIEMKMRYNKSREYKHGKEY